jgi:hypothetical protein
MNGVTHSEGRAVVLPSTGAVLPSILSIRGRDRGELTTTFDGRSRACSFDLAHSYNGATQARTIEGTACGTRVTLRIP